MTIESIVDQVWDKDCEPLSKHCSMEWIVMPEHPMMFGFFQFVYLTNRSIDEFKKSVAPDFICFDAQKCPVLLSTIITINIIDGLTCCHLSSLVNDVEFLNFYQLLSAISSVSQLCWKTGIEKSCTNSSYFHCNQSLKCIPYLRVGDGIDDCFHSEDESFNACHLNDSNRFICESDPNKCLLPVAVGNGHPDCPLEEDELYAYTSSLVKLVPFSSLCNGHTSYGAPSLNVIETDETNCEWWPCNNPYTHCDKRYHCLNGVDELNCPNSQCSSNEHECENELLGLSYCLPINHIFDKYVDNCSDPFISRQIFFYNGTKNISNDYLSWNNTKCAASQEICRNSTFSSIPKIQPDVCILECAEVKWMCTGAVYLIENITYLCYLKSKSYYIVPNPFFTTTRFGDFPSITTNRSIPIIPKYNQERKLVSEIDATFNSYCHRGIAVLYGINQTKICFCPPNYFGLQCQWQNQRVSLTLQFLRGSTTSSNVIFQAIIMLIDENGQITPYFEQITYMPSRDCDTKFNIYLLYPNRPKHISSNYSIRIDLFEKTKLNYWASWYLPISFLFLPVNRIVTQLFIPDVQETRLCSFSCGEHGKCMKYINKKSLFFCQCNQGYYGSRCEKSYECNCANDSYCLAPYICICPLYKFGSYCYLKHSICHLSNNPCQHNGLCVPNDDRIDLKGFTCFCSQGYSGDRCENTNNQIDIHLHDTIVRQTSLLFIHFITSFKDAEHQRITVLKKIPYNRNILTLYVSQPFNILLLQIPNQYYYLGILREIFIPSEYIYTEIKLDQRCFSITELHNSTLTNLGYLRRTKYYPLLCRQYLRMMCFYDNDLICICDVDRFSNCFFFNHTMNYDCQGRHYCENDGQCFQNNETCPTKLTCVCPNCYYGTKCQFSTKGFLFSLDPILSYHVKPNVSLIQQPLIIKISIVISTIMLILGLISGILSIIVFCRVKPRQVGSGYYLLISSITSICMIIILTIKFWQLILSQMSLINNRSLLMFNCMSMDFLLKVLLASSEWLNACVAIERMISVTKGTRFNKQRSKQLAKSVIFSVFFFSIITQIHDPIHRQLIDDIDDDEQRIWCFVEYSYSVRIYNSFITLFHFLVPFSINFITALVIIKKIARRRSNIYPEQSYHDHFQRQMHHHQHLLFAPCMLILLGLPRLIVSFSKSCMKSAREPWFYLIGYFVSFIPSMLTFIVFVLPSKNYKSELRLMYEQTIRRFR
ncbi:unnamed protein product [Rotaria sp. Silwood2]|nr:unnamed protein product [Rotaria sp. Silwood2]